MSAPATAARAAAPRAEVAPALKLARRLTRESRLDEAELVLRRDSADASPAARELARLLQAQRRYGEAEARWRVIVAAAPDDLAALQGLLRVLRLRHRFADAQHAIAAGLDRFTSARPLALEAAQLAMQRESFPDASRWYHRALALPGSAAEPLEELAKALAAQHRFAAARTVLARLVGADPAKAAARESLARIAEEEGDFETAQMRWRELAELELGGPRARLALGRLLEEFGQAADAESLYRDLTETHPESLEPLYQLGRLALVQSNLPAAVVWLARALALEPQDWSAAAALARATAEQHRFAAARARARVLLARLPDHLEAHMLAAWVEERAGKPEAALRMLVSAESAFPQAFLPPLRRAEVLTRSNLVEAARSILEPALAINPDTFSLRLALTDACFAGRDLPSAARQVEALVADYPLHRDVQKRVARLEVLGGRFVNARRVWAEVARFDRRVNGPPLNLERLDDRVIAPAAGEIRLFTRIRNEALRLPWLLDFYRGQGVERFFVVDNGSDDGSRELLLREPDVHLFLTTDSYAVHGGGMRWLNHLLELYGSGTWCLTVDVDELLAYPNAERLGLRALVGHLDRQGAQALRGFMLDMYAPDSLHEVAYASGDDPLAVCPCFDRAGLIERDHPDFPFRMVAGGLVSRFFYDRKQEGVYLHKVPLVRWQSGLRYTSSTHTLYPVALAEESCVLLHLKYMADFIDRAQIEAQRKQYWQGAKRYSVFNRRLAEAATIDFRCDLTERFRSTTQLVELGLLRSTPALDALAAGLGRLPGWRERP